MLWWVPAGHTPTPEEAIKRLELLRREAPGPHAFTFQDFYTPEHARQLAQAPGNSADVSA